MRRSFRYSLASRESNFSTRFMTNHHAPIESDVFNARCPAAVRTKKQQKRTRQFRCSTPSSKRAGIMPTFELASKKRRRRPVTVVNQIRTYCGVARRGLGGKECARLCRWRERQVHPSPKINASVPRCDISCTTAVRAGGVAPRTQQRGQGIPVGSNRLAFQHMRFAKGSAAMSVGRECQLIEV